MITYCNNTIIPIGAKVKVVKNFGNECEPFLNHTGVATQPYKTGSQQSGWVGVLLDNDTIYGRKFNFHVSEIELV